MAVRPIYLRQLHGLRTVASPPNGRMWRAFGGWCPRRLAVVIRVVKADSSEAPLFGDEFGEWVTDAVVRAQGPLVVRCDVASDLVDELGWFRPLTLRRGLPVPEARRAVSATICG